MQEAVCFDHLIFLLSEYPGTINFNVKKPYGRLPLMYNVAESKNVIIFRVTILPIFAETLQLYHTQGYGSRSARSLQFCTGSALELKIA